MSTQTASPRPRRKAPPKHDVIKTWAFDSAGPRKYAVQITKAANGNPCLKIVEGKPLNDGTGQFKKMSLWFWSEDFDRLFATLDEARSYIAEHKIRTPEGHKYDPKRGKGKQRK